MGRLIAYRKSADRDVNLVDHTYVGCDGGRVWSCWGDDGGGDPLRAALGSTKRADRIAGPDGSAGLPGYLINGISHQAANRVLLPAGITVRGARGYRVSEALFGPYGRPVGPDETWAAPLKQHRGVTGDLPRCSARRPNGPVVQSDPAETHYLELVRRVYRQSGTSEPVTLPLRLFCAQIGHRLGETFLVGPLLSRLLEVRMEVEADRTRLDGQYRVGQLTPLRFVAAFNALTVAFQERIAALLSREQYVMLFELEPDDLVVLGDPAIAEFESAVAALRRA